MNLYHEFLFEVFNRPKGSTLSHLQNIGRGKFLNIIPACISEKLIEVYCKNTLGEDLYFITNKGRKYLENQKQ